MKAKLLLQMALGLFAGAVMGGGTWIAGVTAAIVFSVAGLLIPTPNKG